ncbi:MAG: peroxiredoxin [Bacteroidetes bacterium]|nr:MAG: peroxiredoxin [Bacteroidota bacterium]
MLQIGDIAPNFTLFSSEKENIDLSALRGQPVVLLFFPLAFTSTCTTELCGVRDDIAFYDKLNARVLGISVDSPFALGKFKAEQNLNMTLLSDFNKTASTAYDSLYEEFVLGMKGVSKRSAFIIDKEGTIRYTEVLENAGEIPNLERVKEILSELA